MFTDLTVNSADLLTRQIRFHSEVLGVADHVEGLHCLLGKVQGLIRLESFVLDLLAGML